MFDIHYNIFIKKNSLKAKIMNATIKRINIFVKLFIIFVDKINSF